MQDQGSTHDAEVRAAARAGEDRGVSPEPQPPSPRARPKIKLKKYKERPINSLRTNRHQTLARCSQKSASGAPLGPAPRSRRWLCTVVSVGRKTSSPPPSDTDSRDLPRISHTGAISHGCDLEHRISGPRQNSPANPEPIPPPPPAARRRRPSTARRPPPPDRPPPAAHRAPENASAALPPL